MREPLLFGLGAVVGGASGALASWFLAPGPPPPAKVEREPVAQVEPGDAEPSVAADDGQSERVAALERRLSLLTAAYAKLAGNAAAEPGGEPLPSQADVADPVFEAAVLDILDREKERQDTERTARRAEVQKERNDRRTQDLSSRLGLNPRQTTDLGALLARHAEALTRLRDGENPPQTRAEWRERVDTLVGESEQGLAAILSPAQLAEYQKLEPDEKLGGGRGGRGRDNADTRPTAGSASGEPRREPAAQGR